MIAEYGSEYIQLKMQLKYYKYFILKDALQNIKINTFLLFDLFSTT